MERPSITLSNITDPKKHSIILNPAIDKRPSFNITKKKNCIMRPSKIRKSEIINITQSRSSISLPRTESSFKIQQKSNQLLIKLRQQLSEKTSESSEFAIYSQIFKEFSEILPELKDFLMILKQGLVISAIKEREFKDFEFRETVGNTNTEMSDLLEKEKGEKRLMVSKMNKLEDLIDELKAENAKLMKKFEEYEKVFGFEHTTPNETYNLLEKVLDQDRTITNQQNYIHKLQVSESNLKAFIKNFQNKGFESGTKKDSNLISVVNPCIRIGVKSPKYTKMNF